MTHHATGMNTDTSVADLHNAMAHAKAVLPPVAAACVVAQLLAVQHAAGDSDVKRFVGQVLALPNVPQTDTLYARIAAAFAVCREWESTADEYLTSEERDEVGDPRDFSLVKAFAGRIREALTLCFPEDSDVESTADGAA